MAGTWESESLVSELSPRDRRALRQILGQLRTSVEVLALMGEDTISRQFEAVLMELRDLSQGKIQPRLLPGESQHPLSYGWAMGEEPALRIVGANGELLPVEIVGIPTGYQFGAFIQLLLQAGRVRAHLAYAVDSSIKNLRCDVRLDVAVSPTCAFSPQVVRLSQAFALANPARVFARSIDVLQHPAVMDAIDAVPLLTVVIDGVPRAQHLGMLSADGLGKLIREAEREVRHRGPDIHHA